MTDPVDFTQEKKKKEKKGRVNQENCMEAIQSMIDTIDSLEPDDDIRMYMMSMITDKGELHYAVGINPGEELNALGLNERMNMFIHYLIEED